MDVLHVVRAFGEKNQPYTTNLLSKFNSMGQFKHAVISDLIYEKSKTIDVYSAVSSNINKWQLSNSLFILKCFLDRSLRSSTSGYTLRKKIKFFIKWKYLILSTPKVIHLHHLQVFDFPILKYLKTKNIPIICSFRGHDLLIKTRSLEGERRFKEYLAYFDHIHVISCFLKQELLKLSNKVKVDVVYRGGNTPKDENIKRIFNMELSNTVKVVVVGRLVWEKGHVYLLDCIKRFKDKGMNILIDIYGDGKFYEFLEYRIAQLQLKDYIKLKGHLNRDILVEKYKEYDFAIQPSVSEALSNGLLDLTFHNIPCVISNVGGMTEIIKDNVNGVLFDIRDVTSIDEAVNKIANLNFKELSTFNESLREKFSIENEIKGLELIYKEYIK